MGEGKIYHDCHKDYGTTETLNYISDLFHLLQHLKPMKKPSKACVL